MQSNAIFTVSSRAIIELVNIICVTSIIFPDDLGQVSTDGLRPWLQFVFQKYKSEQVIDWTKCCSTELFDREGEELTYDSFKKMVDGKMNRYDLSHISQEIVVRTK